MKIDRHGQAAILTQSDIQLLFTSGMRTNRDRALFGICLYTACRINEACTIRVMDVYDTVGRVRPELIIRKGSTKGKLATRTTPVLEDLRRRLVMYQPPADYHGFLFPGRHNRGHLLADSASWLLRDACKRVGIEGVSTHSFRRTALTQMSDAGIPLRIIQEVSGHRTLDELQKYLEVRPDQVRGALAALSMLSPVEDEAAYFGKTSNYDVDPSPNPKPLESAIATQLGRLDQPQP